MLSRLSIRDVVLIEKLDLDFAGGLCAFTGETGAGKSILLDSLALAAGARSDSSLVRHGAKQLLVGAEFVLPENHAVFDLLNEQGLDFEPGEPLFLRRVVSADGKSRAFINDQAVSAALLRQAGDLLVEIHGQFATHGLLNTATHRGVLDSYGGLEELKQKTQAAYQAWQDKTAEKQAAQADLEKAQAEEDFLRHSVDELRQFNPQPGEEKELGDRRALMMNAEKIAEGLNSARAALSDDGLDRALRQAQRQLENLARYSEGRFDAVIDSLGRIMAELNENAALVESYCDELEFDPRAQEAVEERLFALRALARKHQVTADELPELLAGFERRLGSLEKGGEDLIRLAKEEENLRLDYLESARRLSAARYKAAEKLDTAVANELPPLKLDKAVFKTQIEQLPENLWNAEGMDRVVFTASTNTGLPLAPIAKIASGGELARFMLALKVNLAAAEKIPTLVFDEVDSAIGGATATAVGERLARLATQDCQVLTITHSPQVASFGAHHFRVQKSEAEPGKVLTAVVELDDASRREEIARMLAGAKVTDASRAAADELLKNRSKIR